MKTKLTVMLLIFTGLMILAGQLRGGSSAAAAGKRVNPDYKGGSTFTMVGAGPNVARCGAFPENIEVNFMGSGLDTEGGYNTTVLSACNNPTTNLLFDLKAINTYVQTGDQVFIEADSFVLEPNPAICVATNARGVPFNVTGGTGKYAGATGNGRFHIISQLMSPPCNGQTPPMQLWFEGVIKW